MNHTTHPSWLNAFPSLSKISDTAWYQLLQQVQEITIPADEQVFLEGDSCQQYLLVVDGSVRVQKLSESGREIVLYRVESGQSCVLTTSCLLAGDHYSAEAVTESEVRAVAFPQAAFEQALGASSQFRRFVFASYGERISGLVMLIDAIAFGRMDSRLADYLLHHAKDGVVEATHQHLARELGTAREVISRLLKEFERHGEVNLSRGKVHIQQIHSLASRAMPQAM